MIEQNGIRNCALNTIAPTGTISVVCGCSSGIEPLFAPGYIRKYRDGDELAQEIVIHPLFQRFVADGKSTKHFQGAHELKLRDHFEMQRVCQAHVDNAVSKTINVPQGTSWEELSDLYVEFLPELKGVTVYPDGSREDQPLTPLPNDVAEQHAFDSVLASAGNDSCRTGLCDV
jgi:ribonucleoside-diphosphate reductase alpha chain